LRIRSFEIVGVGAILVPLFETLVDAGAHQIEPRAYPLVGVPEFHRLGEIKRTTRERRRVCPVCLLPECLDVRDALRGREAVNLLATQVVQRDDAEGDFRRVPTATFLVVTASSDSC
jgi:hypothetical protein